jgi:hypothetical protein
MEEIMAHTSNENVRPMNDHGQGKNYGMVIRLRPGKYTCTTNQSEGVLFIQNLVLVAFDSALRFSSMQNS